MRWKGAKKKKKTFEKDQKAAIGGERGEMV